VSATAPAGASTTPRADAALVAALEEARYHPLWTRYKSITPVHPAPADSPMQWRWRDFQPFADRAAREVPIEDVERRAIIMVNPAFGGQTATTSNLLAAFTILEPGDRAVPHRHTAAAIRFATRATGAVTIVNGRRCEMQDGDLVLTPPWCWHGHINEGRDRTYWFDAANMPLLCALDANFFQPGSRENDAFWSVDAGEEAAFAASGLRPVDTEPAPPWGHSPKFRYPGEETRRTLGALRRASDGQRTLRYVNPLTGGPVMPTLDCYATRLVKGAPTQARRVTCNAICLVVAGEGRSTVGDRRFDWSEHDVFTVPHWSWSVHEALSAEADLFMVTDRSVMEALGLLRIEVE
jgi:gentisate 1,2-dioxygenase